MRRDTTRRLIWAVWMGVGGVALAVFTWALTGSFLWALAALLAAGPVLNMVAQLVVRPAQAVRRSARRDDQRGDSGRGG